MYNKIKSHFLENFSESSFCCLLTFVLLFNKNLRIYYNYDIYISAKWESAIVSLILYFLIASLFLDGEEDYRFRFNLFGWYGFKAIILWPSLFFVWPIGRFFVNLIKSPLIDFIDFITPISYEEKSLTQKYIIIKQNKSLTYEEVLALFQDRNRTKFYSPSFSLWPFLLSTSILVFLVSLVFVFHSNFYNLLSKTSILAIFLSAFFGLFFWYSVFFLERFAGKHISIIRSNLKLIFGIFLFTEVLCFLGLFWVYLHSFLAAGMPSGLHNPGEGVVNFYVNELIDLKYFWDLYFHNRGIMIRLSSLPPFDEFYNASYYVGSKETKSDFNRIDFLSKSYIHFVLFDSGQLINPFGLPLINTLVLLCSAATLTGSHSSLKSSMFARSIFLLIVTIVFGFIFMFFQFLEYRSTPLKYNDGIYASCLFSLTGLHGFHVALGICVLFSCYVNILKKNYTPKYHQSYYYAIVYWHFVDVIWLLVYFILYYWPAARYFDDHVRISRREYAASTSDVVDSCVFDVSFSTKSVPILLNELKKVAEYHNDKGYGENEWGPVRWDNHLNLINFFLEFESSYDYNNLKRNPESFADFMTMFHHKFVKIVIDYNLRMRKRYSNYVIKGNRCYEFKSLEEFIEHREDNKKYPRICNDFTCPFHPIDDNLIKKQFERKKMFYDICV